jgi:hypothetical protein
VRSDSLEAGARERPFKRILSSRIDCSAFGYCRPQAVLAEGSFEPNNEAVLHFDRVTVTRVQYATFKQSTSHLSLTNTVPIAEGSEETLLIFRIERRKWTWWCAAIEVPKRSWRFGLWQIMKWDAGFVYRLDYIGNKEASQLLRLDASENGQGMRKLSGAQYSTC